MSSDAKLAAIESRLLGCFEAVFPSLTPEEIRRASHASVAEWDSVAALTLINVLEEEFEIELPLDQVQDLTSFDLIVEHLASKRDE